MMKTPDTFPLWPQGAPLARGEQSEDIPTLTVYEPVPHAATGSAMVICPGGGYGMLAAHEGEDYALFLNTLGLTCFVLQYRLATHGYRHPAMLLDAERAVRTVRARATDWGLNPQRIGIMGSSAGGHLASTLLTHFDDGNAGSDDIIERQSSRPDCGVLCYAVISLQEWSHCGSRDNLLGENASRDIVDELSNERQVTPQTPPCFLWHTGEDEGVTPQNSLHFADALQQNGVPFDLHIYQKGCHGIGLVAKPPFLNPHPWARDLAFWLRENGWIDDN